MNAFEAVSLDQLDDLAKTGLHIGWQRFELISNAIVEQLYDPSHRLNVIAFLQCGEEGSAMRVDSNWSFT